MLFWFIFFIVQVIGFLATMISYSFSYPFVPDELVKLIFIPILYSVDESCDLTLFGKMFFLLLDIIFLPAHLFISLVVVIMWGVYRLFVRG